MAPNKKLYLVSLGCSKNLVDSEVMLGLLEKDGYMVTQKPEDADLLLQEDNDGILLDNDD